MWGQNILVFGQLVSMNICLPYSQIWLSRASGQSLMLSHATLSYPTHSYLLFPNYALALPLRLPFARNVPQVNHQLNGRLDKLHKMAEELEGFHGNLAALDQSLAAVSERVEEAKRAMAEAEDVGQVQQQFQVTNQPL
jgi:hypothetical protein